MAPTTALLPLVWLLSGLAHLATSQTTVRSLPGFDGPLPFDLETGYIEVNGLNEKEIQLFYYFVKSERNPREDPLILWLTGGPGCSGFGALVYEIGPLNFELAEYNGSIPNLVLNPHSWTKVANIIFLDAPVGTGFSFSSDPKGYKTDDKQSAKENYQFLRKWLINHQQFLPNPLYIGGDSYSGIILPMVVQELANGIESGSQPLFNLKGYLLGNPVTDRKFDCDGIVPHAHGMGIISNELYESTRKSCGGVYMKLHSSVCSQNLEAVNECLAGLLMAHILEPNCILVPQKQIEMVGGRPFEENSRRHNVPQLTGYLIGNAATNRKFDFHTKFLFSDIMEDSDIMEECDIGFDCASVFTAERRINGRYLMEDGSHYLITARVYWYLLSYLWANNDTVREALNIQKGTVRAWKRCNRELPYTKEVQSTVQYHRKLTARGYRALIYSGDHDMIIPYVSTQSWIKSLNFSIIDDWRSWSVDSQIAGYTTTYSNNLTFATVKGGGHTAPEYRPKECFAMLHRWLSYNPL